MTSLFKKARDRSSREKARMVSTSSASSFNPMNPLDAPSEVAQAVHGYNALRNNELSFKKGDFFYVINPTPSPDGYIEIYDPTRSIKGRAPASAFKMFEKTHQNDSSSRVASSSSTNNSSPLINQINQSPQKQSVQHPIHMPTLFGIVLYDFNAERSDELSVKTGDKIIICAHHDYEWYIAKFVDKIGEVGLIPVAYVQLIDTLTKIPYKEQPSDIIQREQLPSIEQWKIIKNKHKASVRPVGEAAVASHTAQMSGNHNLIYPQKSLSRTPSDKFNNNTYPEGDVMGLHSTVSTSNSDIFEISNIYPIQANIESFSTSNNKFWFLVIVTMSNGQTKSLCRYYEDFFNYHQRLLSAWPREGGKFDNKDRKDRIIPYIPGPVIDVNESLTHKRMIDLNDYLESLLKLPDYISKSNLVSTFFELLDGDSTNGQFPQPIRNAPPLKILNPDQQSQQQQQQHSSSTPPYDRRYSQSHQDRLSQYEPKRASFTSAKFNELTQNDRTSSKSNLIQTATNNSNSAFNSTADSPKIKLKFYYKDDIFAMHIPVSIHFDELKKMVISKIDEADEPGIENKILILPKNSTNLSDESYDKSQIINSDKSLWNNSNFIDKGKLLVVIV